MKINTTTENKWILEENIIREWMNTIDTVAKEMNTITKQMTDRIMDEICPATLAFIDILEQILI